MKEPKRTLTEQINKAVASLTNLRGVRLLEECQWHDNANAWVIKCRIRIHSPNEELVPNETYWYIWLEAAYPRGEVELIPSKQNGITKTFPHQYYNGEGDPNLPWRKGIICAKTEMFWLKRTGYDIEPFEPEHRLRWHIKQLLQWLLDAATGNLVKEGDPFELPDYDTSDKPYTIAFCESHESLRIWAPLCNRIRTGVVQLGLLRMPVNTFVTLSFKNHDNQLLYHPSWNNNIYNLIQRTSIATWALVPKTIVLPPWQAPMTWGEVACAVGIRGEDYEKLSKTSQFVLMGFPIPNRQGQMLNQIHWQPLLFSNRDNHSRYQNKHESLLSRDLHVINSRADWQKSQNWHPNEIFNRGMYTADIIHSKILIIGAGALGSMTAEMLVRGGVTDIVLVDHEKTEIGNLTRHTLTLKDIGSYKTNALEQHLTNISPYVKVKGIRRTFQNLTKTHKNDIKNASIVLDCTGSDDVLHYLQQFTWESRPFFFSISIGLNAKRLYVLASHRTKFPIVFFQRRLEEWLNKDLEENDRAELPRSGGTGCWHPAFPARVDEMWLWAATALKYCTGYMESSVKCTKVAVFEQVQIGNFFAGIRLTEEYHDM